MSDSKDAYGGHLVNNAGELLDGTWTYHGEENNLQVRNISYPDWKLVQQYAQVAASIEATADAASEDAEAAGELGQAALEQAEQLDNFSWETEGAESDFMMSLIEEKLVKPEVDVGETSSGVLAALVDGMVGAWQSSKDRREAKAEMPLDEGNS